MLTKYPFYSLSCLTPYICVFCRNKENEMKCKQFGQDLKKLYMEESMVTTIVIYDRDHIKKSQETFIYNMQCGCDHKRLFPSYLGMVTTIASPAATVSRKVSVWSRPQGNYGCDNTMFLPKKLSSFGFFWSIFLCVFKGYFHTILGFEL